MLDIQNVSKRYGKTLANDGVSFSVAGGELAVLLGPNGAGKSTLIKCVAGLLRFEGNIQICGHGNKTLEAKRELGYIPEMPAVYDLLTVSEHLEFMRRAWRMEDDGYGEALLKRFEMWDKRDKLGKELSKGMQQKLSICCPFMMQLLLYGQENLPQERCGKSVSVFRMGSLRLPPDRRPPTGPPLSPQRGRRDTRAASDFPRGRQSSQRPPTRPLHTAGPGPRRTPLSRW